MGPFRERRRWRSAKPKVERDRTRGSPAAFAILRALIILMFGALILQLVNLQVLRGAEFKERAEINALREVPLPAARGLISDRNGQPLVENSARFSAAILPGDLPERGEASVYRLLSGVTGVPVEEIDKKVREGVKARGDVLQELAPHAAGLQVITEPSRLYLSGSLLSHVLGYVGPISPEEYTELQDNEYLLRDFIGKTGIESTYESALRGKPGKKLIEVDSTGRELKVISERRPIDGSNLQLSIDLDLQRKTAEVLNEYAAGSDNAAAAVMDVKTGELLAMVSSPGFDNNVFSGPLSDQDLAALVDSPGKPLVNHLVADRYPPGSTFKTIVGAGALQEGVAAPWTTITSRGYITVENEFDPNVVYVYPDWASLGPLDFYGGIAMSSNVYFYYLAGGKADEGFKGLGEEKVAEYARAFGFGEPTGVDLPGESSGLVPDAAWKESTIGEPWTLGDTYNYGIGQGYVAATPLQVLTAISAVANGGELLTPRIVKDFQDSRGRGSGGNDASPAAAKILDYYFNAPKLAQQVNRP